MKVPNKQRYQHPLLSIITINLNNASGLRQTLQSLAVQNWKNFESIIVDGGSTDDSVEIIKHFEDQNALRIGTWVSEKDRGLYHAQNKGIRAAKGKYTLFLNSGDYLFSPKTLENLKPEQWTTDIVYGNILLKSRFREIHSHMPETISWEHLYHNSLMHPATFISRDLFEKVGFYREDFKICSDYYFFVKAILGFHASLTYVNDVISVFSAGGVSSSRKFRTTHDSERNQTIAELFKPEVLLQILRRTEDKMNSFKFAVMAIPRYFVRRYRGL